MKQKLTAVCACFIALSAASNASAATLESRLGGQAYYDPTTNLTWLADANYAKTTNSSLVSDPFGGMTWDNAKIWASNLNVGGVTGWRLPTITTPVYGGSCNGYSCYQGEMNYLIYAELGNTGSFITNPGPFSNIKTFEPYWTSTEWTYEPSPGTYAYNYTMGGGTGYTDTGSSGFAWAVHTGDISAVPLPAAAWVFSSGLIGLIGVARRKKV